MNKFKAFIILFLLIKISPILLAQSSTGSPYTIFGIGDRVNKGFGKSSGLGGSGIGLRDGFSLNNVNPAAYTAIRSPFTQLAQLGLSVTVGNQREAGEHSLTSDLSFSGVALLFRANDKTAFSVGLVPYSKVGYNLTVNQVFTGISVENPVIYEGSGGLNQLYVGTGYDLFKNFSLGAHASVIFGPLKEDQQVRASEYVNNIAINKNLFLATFNLDFGLQYTIPINNSALTLGAVYDYKSKMSAGYSVEIIETLNDGSTTSDKTEEDLDDYILPASFGGGLSWRHKSRWIFMADASFEQWDKATFEEGYSLRNSQRFSAGFSLLPDMASTTFIRRIGVDLGMFYENTYVMVDGIGIDKNGFSMGLNIPVSKTILGLSFQQSYKKPELSNTLVTESYSEVTLNISLLDIWFKRPKYD